MRPVSPLAPLSAALLSAALLSGCGLVDKIKAQLPNPQPSPLVQTLDFRAFDAQQAELVRAGVRVFGPKAKLSQDVEPEYIAVSGDGSRAWVSLQENNALALLDLRAGKVERLVPLGDKDHRQPGAGLDPSDKDGGAKIQSWPVFGMYQPDAIASFSAGDKTYLITANEGDARDYAGFKEETTVGKLKLDPAAFPKAAELQQDAQLGRLTVTTTRGDTDGDGDYDALYAFGARSISVRDAAGALLYDSGDLIEQTTAKTPGVNFNANSTSNAIDTRSDNKGPEPEGVTVGAVGSVQYAFVGLERVGGVMVFDLSMPASPKLVQYLNPRDFSQDPKTAAALDLGPEGLAFVPAADSPNGQPLLIVANEVSGTTTVYSVAPGGQLAVLGRHAAEPAAFDQGAAEIPAYDPASKRVFVVNGAGGRLDILDLKDPAKPTQVGTVDLKGRYGGAGNSVAVRGGVVAVAVQNDADKQAPGQVALLNPDGSERAKPVPVGALPDMLTFTPDGARLLVANEGEPSDDYTKDPEGSVSVIDVAQALARR